MQSVRSLRHSRPAMILLVVLVVVSLLAILGTTFAYRMRADLSAVSAQSNDLQAELAAEAGVERAKLILRQSAMERAGLLARTNQTNDEAWYDNPEAFRQVIVWAPHQIGGRTSFDQHVDEGEPAWRFSLLAPVNESLMGGAQSRFRYGIVDEAGKLNLNTATREQLIRIFEQLQLENVTPEQLADCLLDWREPGETPREFGAKSSYYQTLDPPYKCKGAPLESVEELLLVKYFNGRILYGEDYNRNGHIEPNEDDGKEGLFPPDDGDGILNRGLYAFATVYSRDMNTANDNRPRLNLNALNLDKLPEEMRQIVEEEIPNIQEILSFVQAAKAKKHKFENVAELLVDAKITKAASQSATQPGEGQDATGEQSGPRDSADNATDDNRAPKTDRHDPMNEVGHEMPDAPEDESSEEEQSDRTTDTSTPGGFRVEGRDGPVEPQPEDEDNKIRRRRQSRRDSASGSGEQAPTIDDLKAGRPDLDESAFQESGSSGARQSGGQNADTNAGDKKTSSEGQTGGAQDQPQEEVVEVLPTPVTPADMPGIMNRLTFDSEPIQIGLINVNTAPREVLMTLPGLTAQDADAIVAARQSLSPDAKQTPAWVAVQGVIPPEKFAEIGAYLTARPLQFTIESIGFADHVGTFRRLQVIVEMRGQVEQVLYWRDISALGVGYPLREDEWKNVTASGHR